MRVRIIPADPSKDMEYVDVDGDIRSLQKLVGGSVEVIRTPFLPKIGDVHLVLMVNEDGLLLGLPRNLRASYFRSGCAPLVGDAFICGESADHTEFVGIPDSFTLIRSER